MELKVHVLIVVDGLWHRSGVSSVIMNYYRNIEHSAIQMDFLIFEDNDSSEDLIEEVKEQGSQIFYMPNLGLNNFVTFVKGIDDFFYNHRQYKIVHSHLCIIDFLVFPTAKKYGVQHCISHSHNTKYSDYKLRAIRNRIMCLPITREADYWFACSEAAGVSLYGKRFKTSPKAMVLNNAISCEKFNYDENIRIQKRRELHVEGKKVIGYVGRLAPQKNVEYLIDVFRQLIGHNENDDSVLLIVGDGSLADVLRERVERYRISSQVMFLGQRTDVPELMQAMDILLLPSIYEGLPVVLVEAQISGMPCVASDRITKEVGLSDRIVFVPIGNDDHEKWISNVNRLLTESRESGLELAQKKGFDIRIEAKKLSEFYRDI